MSNSERGMRSARSSFGKRAMWFVILWLVGFGGTVLLVMPFHFLVAAAMRH